MSDNGCLQSGRNFTYPEGYMDHADAYKSALTLNDIIDQASPNEQSWILQDIAQLPFAKTACETGFNAGHHAFHMLTANYDLVMHSFEVRRNIVYWLISTSDTMYSTGLLLAQRFFLELGATKIIFLLIYSLSELLTNRPSRVIFGSWY